MSSSKRRKLDGQPASPSPVSAISAIAARRRLANSVPQATEAESPPEVEAPPPNTNSFSALQALKGSRGASSTPSKGGQKSVRRRNDGQPAGNLDSAGGKSPNSAMSISVASPSLVPSATHSSFRITRENTKARSNGVTQLNLDEGERFVLLGCFGIRVLRGEVTVAGLTLNAAPDIRWVQSAHCCAVPVLRTITDCSMEMHNDPSMNGLRKLGRISPLMRRLWNDSADVSPAATFQLLGTSADAPRKCVIQELAASPEWNKKLSELLSTQKDGKPSATFICGPKSSGKSTFSKLLINRFISLSNQAGSPGRGIAVIDLDPGQPEYAPPGTVSLVHVKGPNLGPSFTHTSFGDATNVVLRCHSLAAVSPASAPEFYLECALDLLETWRRTLRNCPLIINTPGWILGTGLDLLVDLISRIRPTDVIYMSEDGPSEVVETLRANTKQEFSTLPSQPSEFMTRTAAQFRSMQMMSYFHAYSTSETVPRVAWSAQPLSAVRPLEVKYAGVSSGILGILSYDYQSTAQLLEASLNGAIVAIVEIEDVAALTRVGVSPDDGNGKLSGISHTSEGIPFVPNASDEALDPRHSTTIGLALVRGVDTKAKNLQLITPVPLKQIERVRSQGRKVVLVYGRFDSPHWAYTEELYEKSALTGGSENDVDFSGDEELSVEESDTVTETPGRSADLSVIPWVEKLAGNQRRPVGSRVWRVRRDLGRSNTD